MRRFILAALVTLIGTPTLLNAAGSDMRIGDFTGYFCDANVTFRVQERQGNDWIFRGRIDFFHTGESDPMWMEQYEDNSIRVIRYLQGALRGQVQTVQFHPPRRIHHSGGSPFWLWERKQGYGYNCGSYSKGHLVMSEIP